MIMRGGWPHNQSLDEISMPRRRTYAELNSSDSQIVNLHGGTVIIVPPVITVIVVNAASRENEAFLLDGT